jgi:hypothetical protein
MTVGTHAESTWGYFVEWAESTWVWGHRRDNQWPYEIQECLAFSLATICQILSRYRFIHTHIYVCVYYLTLERPGFSLATICPTLIIGPLLQPVGIHDLWCMYVRMYICICICMYVCVCMCVYVCMYVYVCCMPKSIHACINMYILYFLHVYTHVSMHVSSCMYVYSYFYVYASMHECMHHAK